MDERAEPTAGDDLQEGWAKAELVRVGAPHLPAVVDVDAAAPVALFPRDPVKAMQDMQGLVAMMNNLVTSLPAKVRTKYIANIEGRPYPCVTWWTTIALPLQLVPQIAWTKRIDLGEDSGYVKETWHARCEVVHTPSGNIIATGEGICSGEETQWSKSANKYVDRWTDNHAIQAMAQTRAIGRTFRQCLAGLAVMAGLEATPAEEMTDKMRRRKAAPPPADDDAVTRLSYQGDPIGADQIPTGKWVELFPIDSVRNGWFRCEHINGGFKVDGDYALADDLVDKVPIVRIIRSGCKADKPWAIIAPPRFKEEANDLNQDSATDAAGPQSVSADPPPSREHTPKTGDDELTFWHFRVKDAVRRLPPGCKVTVPEGWEQWTSTGELERLDIRLREYLPEEPEEE